MLYSRIKQDQQSYRKAKDHALAGILGCVLGDAVNLATKSEKRDPTDEECLKIIRKTVAGLDEVLQYSNTIVDANQRACLVKYLPQQITGQDLYNEIYSYCMADGDNVRLKDIMTYLARTFPGCYDGKEASEIAKVLTARN